MAMNLRNAQVLGDSSGSDSAGPVSSSTVTIGGESFAVDPRGGNLNYSFTFFNGNVNYGQTPFSLSIQYQQNAAGSYVGAFTDNDEHSHPYGVSAYLPTPQPKATEGNGSQLNDAGGIWDLNLPYLFISTSKVSKFYGSNQIAATLSLGDTSYQILMEMPSTNQTQYISDYTTGFLSAAQSSGPLYSVDGRLLRFGQGQQPDQILVQDKYGTHFLFAAAVLYGYKGINVYDPTDNSSNNADADQILVYRIINIFYANGQTLNFSYTDPSWTGTQQHTLTITDTIGNTIATLNCNGCTGTVCISNQAGALAATHQLNLSPGDYRLLSIKDLTTNRSLNYQYIVNQDVPYGWQNQTSLSSIQNGYTGYQTEITYQQFNSNHAYDAGCTQFSLGEIAVSCVTNKDNTGTPISSALYNFDFSSSGPNFVMPQASGKKTYASGLNHWLDNVFYTNKDSSGCSSSDRVEAVDLGYATIINTIYPESQRNRTQSKQYDALGRATQESISNSSGILTTTSYSYQNSTTELQSLGSFSNLPFSYGSPISTNSALNIATLNGVIIGGEPGNDSNMILLSKIQQYTYNAAGNPTQEISPLGQVTDYTYLPADQTTPNNERLVQSVKTYSIGNNGASFVLETQTFDTFNIAPTDGGFFLSQATLPTSNVEQHFEASSNTTYTYRTDTMGGYIGGYNYSDGVNVGLNGILTLRGQQDNTGASDIASLQNQTTAAFTTLPNLTQPVLSISSCITGTTTTGETTSMDRGGCLIHFMGYPLQLTNAFGQITLQTYDNLGRLISVTTLAETQWSQTTSYAYDLPEDLALAAGALFGRRQTDPYGNLHIQLFDARQRHIASFQTLTDCQLVQTAAYSYDDANNLVSASQYGHNYVRTTANYYSPGTQLLIASVPNDGLASGRLLDALNGITFQFDYAPASTDTPTVIGQIYGPVKISQVDNNTQLLLADGLLDAEAANTALVGFDLVNIPTTTPLVGVSGNSWVNSGQAAQPLLALYQAMAQSPANASTPGSACHWLELNTYAYDEWNRQISRSHSTFVNHGSGLEATPTLSITINGRSFQTAERAITLTYPQGQAKTSTYNLLNGLQAATLTANGILTPLGSLRHDGLGRILTYTDSLNGSQSTATYTPTGQLSTRTDAYGNTTTYTYDPVSFKLTQTTIVSADEGESVVVNRQYDNHLRLTEAQDGQGNTWQWSFTPSGLLGSRSISLGAVNPNSPLQTSFSYDNFGDLVHVADPFLPYPLQEGNSCSMVQCNSSVHGYNINRDAYGRISQLMAGSFHGVNRNFSFHPVTGLLINDTLANLPATFGCGDTGTLSLCTSYTYDTNLRTISKAVSRSDSTGPDATAHFSQTYDTSNRVASRQRQDFQGNLLNECFSYDLETGSLTGYANSGGTAAPFSGLSGLGAISSALYSYDVYGNLLEVSLAGATGSSLNGLQRSYTYPSPASNGTLPNPFRLLATQDTVTQDGEISNTSGSFSYDQAGNVISDSSGRTFTYDLHGLIQSIQRADQQKETFVRDGLGRIVQRNASWLNGAVHDFGTARFLENSQLWQKRFFAGTACCVGSLNQASTAVSPIHEQPAFWSIDDLSRQAINTLSYGGNTSGFLLLNATSHLPYGVATNLLDPSSGYPADLDNADAYPASVMGTALGADVGTGLLILGDYRAFDPALGRFLQWDDLSPFGKGGLNGYAYAGNDPVNFWDPSGHYQSVKSKRYGPRPLEAHHHSDGGFWDGFLAGMIHGAKAFYMTPYNYAKGFYEDIAHHHWVGALKMGFDAAVETTIQVEVGMLGTMVLQEFITMSPSSIFSGKSPVKTDSTGHRSPYQWGYGLGNEAGGLAVTLAVAIVTFVIGFVASGIGDLVDGLSTDSASGNMAADANVSGDASNVSRLQNAENSNGHLDQIDIRAHDDRPEEGAENAARPGAEADAPSRSQRVLNGLRKFASWGFRKGILPHDPEDPFPWEENLTTGQRAKAFVTFTSETLNESRKFVTRLASWGGTSTPQGASRGGGASWRTSSTPPEGDQGLDPQHQSAAGGQADTPYQPPLPPPPDLPGR